MACHYFAKEKDHELRELLKEAEGKRTRRKVATIVPSSGDKSERLSNDFARTKDRKRQSRVRLIKLSFCLPDAFR